MKNKAVWSLIKREATPWAFGLIFGAWMFMTIMTSSGACAAHPPPQLPAGGLTIVRAKQAVVAIGTLQSAAIGLNKTQVCTPEPCHPLLSDHNTGLVVDAVRDALLTMDRVPDGAFATAAAALEQIKGRLDAAGKSQFDPYIAGVQTTLTNLTRVNP